MALDLKKKDGFLFGRSDQDLSLKVTPRMKQGLQDLADAFGYNSMSELVKDMLSQGLTEYVKKGTIKIRNDKEIEQTKSGSTKAPKKS